MTTVIVLLSAILAAVDGDTVQVALLNCGGVTTKCASDAFLTLADRESSAEVAREFASVDAGNERLFEYPFVIFAGEGAFELTDAEAANLRRYLQRGGFILATSKCESPEFDASFRAAMSQILSGAGVGVAMQPLPPDHAVLHTLFDVREIVTVKPSEHPLWGVEIDGRLSVLYSPIGLTDSADLSVECCCCGANEIRNARQINANALIYALTH